MQKTSLSLQAPPPWFWVLVVPFLFVLTAVTALVSFAIIGADARVNDNYYKEGRMINADFRAEEKARQLNILGDLSFDLKQNEVKLELANAPLFDDNISLFLRHPSDANRDTHLTLKRVSQTNSVVHYHANIPDSLLGRWYFRIENNHQDPWRLFGEIDLNSQTYFSLKARNTN